MGSSSSDDEDAALPRRRNARSLDMGSSSREASKAAAWMWHMHSSSSSTFKKEMQEKHPDFANLESKRRNNSCDRKDSRFRQEATALASTTSISTTSLKPVASPHSKAPQDSFWDCGSKLYDTFELVSFSNRLDRSLLGVPGFDTSNLHHVAQSPLQQHHSTFAGVLRTFSLPRTLSVRNSTMAAMAVPPRPSNDYFKPSSRDVTHANNANGASDTGHATLSDSQDTFVGRPRAMKRKFSALRGVLTTKWSFSKLARVLRKVGKFRKEMQCFRPRTTRSKSVTNDKAKLMGDEDDGGAMPENWYKNVTSETMVDEDEVDNGTSEHRYRAYEQKGNEGKHVHHHHHHYHHHFVHQMHQIDQFSQAAKEDDVYKPWMSADRVGADAAGPPGRAESARLSSDTLSRICADVNWL